MKLKTYVLMISPQFPASHPRKGEETGFFEAIGNGLKIHTVRNNYELWEKRIKEVQEGKAVLSLRRWSGRPYRSRQEEKFVLKKIHGVGIQKLIFRDVWDGTAAQVFNPGKKISCCFSVFGSIEKNDGLSEKDFQSWFLKNNEWPQEPLAIIHFTDFRYKAME